MPAFLVLRGCVCIALLIAGSLAMADDPQPLVVRLWNGEAPGSEGKADPERTVTLGRAFERESETHRRVSGIHVPSLTVFLPADALNTGSAAVICPGGGHRFLSIDSEGLAVARWLANRGVAAMVLKYRLANEPGSEYTVEQHALADVRRAVQTVRHRSEEWRVSADRIGVLGFSAGGDLALLAALRPVEGQPDSVDPVHHASSRPNFGALLYPVGPDRRSEVNEGTCPMFLVAANDDSAAGDNCLEIYRALRHHSVPAEIHLFARGGHGFGIVHRPYPIARWPERLDEWLVDQGFFTPYGEELPPARSGEHAPPGLVGTWKLSVEGTGSTVTFSNAADGLRGTYDNGNGPVPVTKIGYAAGNLLFQAETNFYDRKTVLVFRGVMRETTLRGEMEYIREGSKVPGAIDFVGHREDAEPVASEEASP